MTILHRRVYMAFFECFTYVQIEELLKQKLLNEKYFLHTNENIFFYVSMKYIFTYQ